VFAGCRSRHARTTHLVPRATLAVGDEAGEVHLPRARIARRARVGASHRHPCRGNVSHRFRLRRRSEMSLRPSRKKCLRPAEALRGYTGRRSPRGRTGRKPAAALPEHPPTSTAVRRCSSFRSRRRTRRARRRARAVFTPSSSRQYQPSGRGAGSRPLDRLRTARLERPRAASSCASSLEMVLLSDSRDPQPFVTSRASSSATAGCALSATPAGEEGDGNPGGVGRCGRGARPPGA